METVKEKLAKLIEKARMYNDDECEKYALCSDCPYPSKTCIDLHMADHLIQNGVTIQDAKPLNEFLAPIDEYSGLKQKYLVFKADSGERVMDCFVLRPQKDAAAAEALRAYANATDNKVLAEDIRNWIGESEPLQECGRDCKNCWKTKLVNPVQEWVSVDERLPEVHDEYIVIIEGAKRATWLFYNGDGEWICEVGNPYKVTHWQPFPDVPQPPKEVQ